MIKSTFFSPGRMNSKNAQVASDLGQRIILGRYPVETTLPREAEYFEKPSRRWNRKEWWNRASSAESP